MEMCEAEGPPGMWKEQRIKLSWAEDPLWPPIVLESLCPQPCFPLSLPHCAAYLGNPVEFLPTYASLWIGRQKWLPDLCSKR